MNDRQKAFFSIVLVSLFGGAMGAVTKIGLSNIPPLSFAFIRFFIAFLIIIPFIRKAERKIIKDFVALAPISLLATINIVLFTLGVKATTATISGLLYAATPLIIALFSYLFIAEKLNRNKILGIIIGFMGVLVVVFLPFLEKGKAFSGDLFGNLLISAAVVCWSFYMIFSKKMQKTYSPFVIVSIFTILTTLALFPFFLVDLKLNYGWWNGVEISSFISLFYAGAVGTVMSYLLNQYAIRHGGSVFASMAFYIQPLFAFLSAFFLLGEGLTLGILLGGSLALIGVFFVTKK